MPEPASTALSAPRLALGDAAADYQAAVERAGAEEWVNRLFARDGRTLTELESELAMTRFGVMKHLRVLENAGLLRRRRYGRVHEMQLDAEPLKKAAQWVEEYRKFWETMKRGISI